MSESLALATLQEQVARLHHVAAHEDGRLRTFTGVDLAVQRNHGAGRTVMFTLALRPPPDNSRHVLCVESGRWPGNEIISRLVQTHYRFDSTLIVENNAAQDWIIQFTRDTAVIPIIPFTTGRNKAHPEFGVEGLATELAQGKWVIPSMGGIDPEVQAWIDEMIAYDPLSHTGDRLMAAWLAREGARRMEAQRSRNMVGVRMFS